MEREMDKAEMEDRRGNGDEDKGDEDEAQNEMDRFWTRFGGDHASSSTQPTKKNPRRGDRRRICSQKDSRRKMS